MNKKYRVLVGEKITAEIAKQYMKKNPVNRSLRKRSINTICYDIMGDMWVPQTGANLVFDWYGILRDGQHRCSGLIQAQELENEVAKTEKRRPKIYSIVIDIVKGVDPDAIRSIDTGRKRSGADTLTMEFKQQGVNVKNPKYISGALSFILCHENGNIYEKITISNNDVWKALQKHKDLIQMNEIISPLSFLVSKGYILALYKIFSMVPSHRHLVREFFESFSTGENLKKNSPVLVLRNKIINVPKGETLKPSAILCYIIKTWNYYVKGEVIRHIEYSGKNLPQPPHKIKNTKKAPSKP